MTLKELFKKYNAQPGFKFKFQGGFSIFEVLYFGNKSVFAKDLLDGEESSFDLDMKGYEKHEESNKTKKIMVADYYNILINNVCTQAEQSPGPYYKKVIGSDREILVECDK